MKRILLLIVFVPFFCFAQLRISELMTNNVSFNLDDSFNYSMWVEVYNPSTNPVNASFYWFSDKLTQPFKWKPSDTLIAPSSFQLFYFERADRPGHASFKLDPTGGTLYLFGQDGLLVDSMTYPAQFRNCSYGRVNTSTQDAAFFVQPTPGAKNSSVTPAIQCAAPVASLSGGIFAASQMLRFQCEAGDTVYYTTDCSEPTRLSTRFFPLSPISITSTKVIRARTFCKGKIPGPIVTNTYFVSIRNHQLPVISITTCQANLTDPGTGIYCEGNGINGTLSRYETVKRNYYADWNRPINFELYDTTGVQCLNQEVDTKILGGWTRKLASKSLAISPKKKFGSTRLDYDFFNASKPNRKYKDIQVRNSGNDFTYSMFRDGLMQTVVKDRIPSLDYMAYEPAVLYLNGAYWGIGNLRERSNENWVYSNYGLDEDKIYTMEAVKDQDTDKDMATDTAFLHLSDYLKTNDPANPEVYAEICRKIDADNFMAYMIAELYTSNSDWPNNNVKMWRQLPGGSWHWILSDLDFGMSLYSDNEASNMLLVAMGESGDRPEWSTIVFKSLLKNETFRNSFIDRFTVHLSTTFAPERVSHYIDSLSAKIANEISYHKARFGSSRTFAADLALMKSFAAARPANMLRFLSNRFLNAAPLSSISLEANVSGATFSFNKQVVSDPACWIQTFKGRSYSIQANPPAGYTFDHWEKTYLSSEDTLLAKGSSWRFFDGNAFPSADWNASTFDDLSWKTGFAPLGYGGKGEVTVLDYGGNASAKFPTSCYRTHFSVSDIKTQSNFRVNVLADDGAIVYINGAEIGRLNMPSGITSFSTYSLSSNNGITGTYTIPPALLTAGQNTIAVEVHQCNASSSDLLLDLSIVCDHAVPAAVEQVSDTLFTETLNRPFSLRAVCEKTTVPETMPSNVFINEILPSNSQIPDEFDEKDDVIELYNASDFPVNIAGWYLSDEAVNPRKATIPFVSDGSATIPARGFLLLWADDTPVQGALHLPFKLSASGETVLLSRPHASSFEIVDSVTYSQLNSNESWSRICDASAFWAVRPQTIGISNNPVQAVESVTTPDNTRIWPVNVHDVLHIQTTNHVPLQLYDTKGRLRIRVQAQAGETTLDVSSLPAGLYLLRAGTHLHKLIKH